MKVCRLEMCDKPLGRNGLCEGHNTQQVRGKEFTPLRTRKVLHKDAEGRVCTTCEEYKSWDEFYKRPTGGALAVCKMCFLAYEKSSRAS